MCVPMCELVCVCVCVCVRVSVSVCVSESVCVKEGHTTYCMCVHVYKREEEKGKILSMK